MEQKIAGRSSDGDLSLHPITKISLSVNTAVKGYPFSNQGRIRQRKERDWLRLSSALPKIPWASNPHCLPLGYEKPLPVLICVANLS